MKILEIDNTTGLEHLLKELQDTPEKSLEISAVSGQPTILDNPLNKQILQIAAKEFNKEIVFPSVPIEQSEPAGEQGDDLGFVEGEDVVSKVPMEQVRKMINNPPVVKKAGGSKRPLLPDFVKDRRFQIGALVVGILLVLFGLLLMLPSATITLTLATQNKEAQMDITADSSINSVDVSNAKVSLQTQTQAEENTDQVTATGKKNVGTAAKGRVTIYNQDPTNTKTFLAGTTITPVASSSATFTLDSDVTVEKAPTLGDTAQAAVFVTATQPGPDSNLAAGTKFNVNSLQILVYAQNDTAFSGGSLKQITVASQEDKNGLRQKLIDSLTTQAQSDLEKNLKGKITITGATDTQVVNEVYTPNSLDTETTSLKANLKIQATAYLINADDLKILLVGKLKQTLPSGFQVADKDMSFEATLVNKNPDGTLAIKAKIKANLVPQLSENKLKTALAGKSLDSVKSYFNNIREVDGYKIEVNPSLWRLFGRMPFLGGKIRIVY